MVMISSFKKFNRYGTISDIYFLIKKNRKYRPMTYSKLLYNLWDKWWILKGDFKIIYVLLKVRSIYKKISTKYFLFLVWILSPLFIILGMLSWFKHATIRFCHITAAYYESFYLAVKDNRVAKSFRTSYIGKFRK